MSDYLFCADYIGIIKNTQGLRVGVNLAFAIALHNIPEVQKSTYRPFWLSNLKILV
jgi:hypothetical protein